MTRSNDFNSSIPLRPAVPAGHHRSIAHATMLGEQGIIAKEEAEKIVTTLKTLLEEIEEGKVEFTKDSEDIHMNMEVLLTQRIGATGKRLHTARSRNDQVAVDFRMYVRKEIQAIIGLILDLEKVLVRKAEANLDTVMPGLHPPPAGPAHHLRPRHDGLRQHVQAGRDPAGGLSGAAGRVPPGGRRSGHYHLTRWTGSRRPSFGFRSHRQLHGLGFRPGLRH